MKTVGIAGDPNLEAVQSAFAALGHLPNSAPVFLLTKFEAFRARGSSDLLSSHDLEDIMTVVDGREELEGEISKAPEEIQAAIREQFDELISDARLVEAMAGFLPGDAASQARLPDLLARLNRLAK